MHTYKNKKCNSANQACAITIGNFDGVHLGHQKLFQKLVQKASIYNMTPSALTFHPHSREYFKQNKISRIYNTRDKIKLITKHGMNQIMIQRFDDIINIEADLFIDYFLIRKLNMKLLIIGENFRFGYQRQGDLELLKKASTKYGFQLYTIEDVNNNITGSIVSSSKLRDLLKKSDLETSRRLLGRIFGISGHVIHGKKIGRKLGFPTMNINVPQNYALEKGVYIVRVYGLKNKILPGVANLGIRESIEINGSLLLEIHLIDDNIDAYGKIIYIEFLKKIRNEEKFTNIKSLINAISNDIKNARSYFANNGL
ncbi:bifunctional riboflavin kinase/FAD synthetase [Candidatus Kinetoplastidibacterium crithidiae]|uniref:bifunctional riboflavin kinase/FAD synthetase n=1 Tax=Candidatus Kinetoplastidibacterium crithidiae TaxID=33056 RepID=UPI001CEFA2D0|nr:bifunctional riboflavin kinase/FAD synthetase [Candidatus Kinetoplastibacterium crithidii]